MCRGVSIASARAFKNTGGLRDVSDHDVNGGCWYNEVFLSRFFVRERCQRPAKTLHEEGRVRRRRPARLAVRAALGMRATVRSKMRAVLFVLAVIGG